ncbi:hypothetical protein KG088_11470 [Halomonas sp. TRM85114]|uniref:hypothetical protein n=1 Tax=Halomonas jincaotanensis TaxID=2810616 RepID=UPI001BD438B7|nr:hypothetical protein [Halomonas jincaotanensis]MBS9404251.1 hypothetical protein [Halomonas jincaotanensis]
MKLTTWLTLATLAMAPHSHAMGTDRLHSEHGDDMIQLDITGKEGTRFNGNVTIHAGGDTQHRQLDGSVPTRLTFQGEGIDLELTQNSEGNLFIEVHKGGNRSSSRVTGQGSRVRLSVQ